MANLARELIEAVGKPNDKLATQNLFAAVQVSPAKLAVLDDIKATLGFRLLSAIKLYADCELGREIGSYQSLLEKTQQLEFCITLLDKKSPEAVPPQAVKTNSLRQIYTLCDNQSFHLNRLSESECSDIYKKLEPLKRYAYVYVFQEIEGAVEKLSKAGVILNPQVQDRIAAVVKEAKQKGGENISIDEAKKAAKDVMGLFQLHNQLEDKSMPEKIDSISKSLFECFDRACEKIVALGK